MHVSAACLLHIAFRRVMPQCCRLLCFKKACETTLLLQLLRLTPCSSSANSGEAQSPPWPQQIPEWGLMMQRGRKAPAPSSSADSPARLAVKVVAMMKRSLRELWHPSNPAGEYSHSTQQYLVVLESISYT